jgi:putative flippase GtrA
VTQVQEPRGRRLRSLVLFCVSGGLALFVDIGVLYALKALLGNYGARVVSFWCAATFTWAFNRTFTFEGSKHGGMVAQYLSYMAAMVVGGALNYATYALAVSSVAAVARQPALGVALGSLVGLTFNYLSARRIMQKKT